MAKITSSKVSEEVRRKIAQGHQPPSKPPANPRPPARNPGELRMDTDYDPDPRGDQPEVQKKP